jgi:hypothetical protein
MPGAGRVISALCQRIRDIAMNRPRFGYLRVLVMLKREGRQVGKKRVYRLYRQQGLQLRMKVKRRKRIALLRGKPQMPTGPNQHWSMDFVHDQMLDGRAFRILTVIDQWSRESVCLEANFKLSGRCVGQAPDRPCSTTWMAQGHHRGQRHGVHVQGPGRVGISPGISSVTRGRQAHGQRADRVVQWPASR